MRISSRHIGKVNNGASIIIELTFDFWDEQVIEDVTDANGYVDEDFINDLRTIADELEEQNRLKQEEQNRLKQEKGL